MYKINPLNNFGCHQARQRFLHFYHIRFTIVQLILDSNHEIIKYIVKYHRADVIQTLTMVLVSGAFIIQATVQAGGPAQVISDNVEGRRLEFLK